MARSTVCPYCEDDFQTDEALDEHLDNFCPKEVEPDDDRPAQG